MPDKDPAAGGTGAVTHPRKFSLDGGATLLLEEDHSLPLVTLSLVHKSGSASDPQGKEGAARLAMRMLRRGADGLSSKEIEDTIDRLGAEVGTDVSPSGITVGAQVIKNNLEPLTDLLVRLVGSPAFPPDELERLKRETIAEIIESRDSDRALAHRAFRKELFAGHLYGRSSTGTTPTVRGLSGEDARAAYAFHSKRGNIVLGVSGDADEREARHLADRLLGVIPEGAAPADPVTEPEPRKGRRLVFVDKPERTQTQILIGGLGTSPFDDDHISLSVANAAFGGTFTSRLMREVRGKRGWSYGAYSRLGVDRHRQAFSLWTFPGQGDAAACIRLEMDLLKAFVDKGITPGELSFVRRYLVRSRAFDMDTASKRLHLGLDVEALGLPADYHTGYIPRVKAVTREGAGAAVRARIALDDLLVVVVGTASEVLEPVKAAIEGLAEVTVVPFDAD